MKFTAAYLKERELGQIDMTYSESAEGIYITYQRAMQELKSHGVYDQETIEAFDKQFGKKDFYSATEVLQWLGY